MKKTTQTILLLVLPLLVLSVGAATSLSLNSPRLWSTNSWEKCSTSDVKASISGKQIFFELPEDCVGALMRVSVSNSFRELTESSIAAANNVIEFNEEIEDTTALFLSLDTWWMPASYRIDTNEEIDFTVVKCEVEKSSDGIQYPCEASFRVSSSWDNNYIIMITVSTESPSWVRWKVTFDGKDSPPLPILAKNFKTSSEQLNLANIPNCTDKIIEMVGPTTWGPNGDKITKGSPNGNLQIFGTNDPVSGSYVLLSCP